MVVCKMALEIWQCGMNPRVTGERDLGWRLETKSQVLIVRTSELRGLIERKEKRSASKIVCLWVFIRRRKSRES